ncbi:MAG TPA: hypothetical protein VM600_05755, partial [Actinomycetota bacterium]|nr:hypothetical protein [Actinomycetota bacterium]
MRRTFPRLIAFAAMLAIVVPPPPPVLAAASPRAGLTSARSLDATDWPVGRKLLELGPITLTEGESRLIYGRLTAINEATRNLEQQVGVGCDATEGGTMRTSRNNEGSDRAYPAGRGILTIDVRYLHTARASGTFVCSLWAKSSGNTMTAMAGVTRTFIEASDPAAGAVQWGLDQPCDSNGTISNTPDVSYDSECRYV